MRKYLCVVGAILLCLVLGASTDPPKIAVASMGSEANSDISDMAARAPFILIFDHEGDLVETIENTDVPAQGAGPYMARLLSERGVTHYIAEKSGPNLIRALEGVEIEHVEMQGGAKAAVMRLLGVRSRGRPVPQ